MKHDELWQEYAPNGEPLETAGREPSLGAPKVGSNKYVSCALVWLYRWANDNIEILFQKRSPYVDHHPNLWDISAGGHINVGETVISAAVREVKEEIGVDINPDKLEPIISLCPKENGVNLFIHEYLYDWTGEPNDFHFDDREVSEVKWVPLSQFDEFVDQYAKPPLKGDTLVRMAIVENCLQKIQDGNH